MQQDWPQKTAQGISTATARHGSQAVARACAVLRALSTHGRRGTSLGTIALDVGIDRATARRILLELIANGFVAQDMSSRLYFIGLNLFSIAALAADRFNLADERRKTLANLCRLTRCSAVYFAIAGDDLVCADSVCAGPAEHLAAIGLRRPIGLDAFGVALLAAMPEEACEAMVLRHARRLPHDAEGYLRTVSEKLRGTRAAGISITVDSETGVCAIAQALTDADGDVEGVIGVFAELDGMSITSVEASRLVIHHCRQLQYHLWRLPRAAAELPVV